MTTIGLPAPVAVFPSGDEVTVYEVIAAPPSDDGGVKLTLACPSPAVAVTAVGCPGTVAVANTHAAPTSVLSWWPPIRAVFPSDDNAAT